MNPKDKTAKSKKSVKKNPFKSTPAVLRLKTFSYLPGCVLFHKIALTNKKIRNQLKGAGLLDQDKVITFKLPETESEFYSFSVSSLEYALDIASSIQVQVINGYLRYTKAMFKIIESLQAKRN